MTLVPSGKTRRMVAQNFSNPLSEGFFDDSNQLNDSSVDDNSFSRPSLETDSVMEEDVGGKGLNDKHNLNKENSEFQNKEKGRKTLTTYIFEKLESYGYPGRRLQEFKSEFVKESVSPDGIKDLEIVIPDKKYPDERGFTDTVENEELRDIAHEINQMFGLNFNGAERSGGKWTIKFTSENLTKPEEEGTIRDSLDQVYGKPDKSKQPESRQISASSLREMIKKQKDKVVNQLRKINGD